MASVPFMLAIETLAVHVLKTDDGPDRDAAEDIVDACNRWRSGLSVEVDPEPMGAPIDLLRAEEPWTWAQVEIVGHRTHWARVRTSGDYIEVVEPAVEIDAEPDGEPRRNDAREWGLYLDSAPPEAMVQRYLLPVSLPEARHEYRRSVALFGLHETTEERVRAARLGEVRTSEWRVVPVAELQIGDTYVDSTGDVLVVVDPATGSIRWALLGDVWGGLEDSGIIIEGLPNYLRSTTPLRVGLGTLPTEDEVRALLAEAIADGRIPARVDPPPPPPASEPDDDGMPS